MKRSTFYVRVLLGPIVGLACAAGLHRSAYAVDIDWVTVGNPGNPADTFNETHGRAWGGVNYTYRIGKYEVTNAQYAEFLNAKAAIGDPLQLYDMQMSSGAVGGINRSGGGTEGDPFVYTLKSGRGNNPVVFVNWYDALRFANWLNNGQGSSDTESGSYTLLGGTPEPSNAFPYPIPIARNPGARVVLPSEDEWYKAAYHKNDGVTGNYWDFPTATDEVPFSDQPPGADAPTPSNTANQAFSDGIANNYDDGYAVTGSSSFSDTQNYLTDVGAYTDSISPYGTFDQAGNVSEWTDTTDTPFVGFPRILRGGDWGCCFGSPGGAAAAWSSGGDNPSLNFLRFGFRVAMVPEPSSLVLAALGLGLLAAWRRRVFGHRVAVPQHHNILSHHERGEIDIGTLKRSCLGIAVLWLTGWCGAAHAAEPFFMGLGDLPGYPFSSGASAVSADGSVVVGNGAVDAISSHGEPPFRTLYRAFRRSQGQESINLGLLSNSESEAAVSFGDDVSADGSVVVGMSGVHPIMAAPYGEAFRWRQGSGMVGLGVLSGRSYSRASGVSADGLVIVGRSWTGIRSTAGEAFRWTQDSGMVGLGDLPGGIFDSSAHGISANGSVIVGASNSASGTEAFRWTQAGGMLGLGDLPSGSFDSLASGVSADGSVVVGRSVSASGYEAFRWTQDSGMVGLGDLPEGSFFSEASNVTADGSIVVGRGRIAAGDEAFLWNATDGMRSLRDVLINSFRLGASLAGWTLTSANDISADGQFIVGSGRNPNGDSEAWIARLGPEPTLPGDYNSDGRVDAADYVVWRKGLNTTYTAAGYDVWKTNFGVTAANAAPSTVIDASVSVPEPSAISLCVLGVLATNLLRTPDRIKRFSWI